MKVLTHSPKISYLTKNDFFLLNVVQTDKKIEQMCFSAGSSCLWDSFEFLVFKNRTFYSFRNQFFSDSIISDFFKHAVKSQENPLVSYIITFELKTVSSHYFDKNICNTKSTCYNAVLKSHI